MEDKTSKGHLLSNKVYDTLKIIALIILPAFGTFYFAIAQIWGLPAADEVVKSIIAFDTFLGVIVKLGDASYNASEARYDGQLVVQPNEDGTGGMVNLELHERNPETIAKEQDEVILKVKPL